MRKYGIEHFYIELLEETDKPEEREIYWIEKKQSFKNGYNATIGGDGKRYLDYDLIIATYDEVKSISETAVICNCSIDSVSNILNIYHIDKLTSEEVNIQKRGNVINQYDINGNFIQSFPSIKAAARYLNKKGISHISDACKGKRNTAYEYKWKYAN